MFAKSRLRSRLALICFNLSGDCLAKPFVLNMVKVIRFEDRYLDDHWRPLISLFIFEHIGCPSDYVEYRSFVKFSDKIVVEWRLEK